MKIALIGAGINSLVTAYYLNRSPANEITLFEADKIGGKNKTENIEGNLLESRDDYVFLKNPLFLNLCRSLDLDIVFAKKDIKKRLIPKEAQFFYSPLNMHSLQKTSLFFILDKLKISRSFKKKYSFWPGMSVYEAFKSVFGQTAADYIASPLMRYLFYSEAEDVELASGLPREFESLQTTKDIASALKNAEREEKEYWMQKVDTDEYDSLKVKHMTPGKGFDTLISSLKENLKANKVSFESAKIHGFKIQQNKYFLQSKALKSESFDRVIFCISPLELGKIWRDVDKNLYQHLQEVTRSQVTSIYHCWPKDKFKIAGHGIFSPRVEKTGFLFSLFLSNLFPDKFAKENFITRTYISGGNEIFSDADMARISLEGVKRVLKIKAEPIWDRVYRSRDFIKREPKHLEWQQKLQDILKKYGNLSIHPSSLYLDSWSSLLENSFHLAEG